LQSAVPEDDAAAIEAELTRMSSVYQEQGAGFQLIETGGGFQLRTHPELHEYVTRFLVGRKRSRLSRAAMETLAIVAYRQPLTRGEMEQIRGVDCGQVLHTLLERSMVAIRGRSQALGRPLLYGTTEEFLHYFGIASLADLPTPDELESLIGNDPLSDPEIREALEAHGLGETAEDGLRPQEDVPLEGRDAAGGECG
jgi:segregation and condensation protein B